MALLTRGSTVYLFSLSPMVNLPFGSTERGCCLMPTSCRARRALLLHSYPPNLRSIPCRFTGMYYTVLSEHGRAEEEEFPKICIALRRRSSSIRGPLPQPSLPFGKARLVGRMDGHGHIFGPQKLFSLQPWVGWL